MQGAYLLILVTYMEDSWKRAEDLTLKKGCSFVNAELLHSSEASTNDLGGSLLNDIKD